jgi:uncharacterized membrane protein YvbJ
MGVCPRCNIEYEEGEKFCRRCGSFLLTEEGSTFELPIVESTESEETEKNLFCPNCQEFYEKEKYCRKCGFLLVQEVPSQELKDQLFKKKLLRSRGKEWLKFPRPLLLITTSIVILLIIIGGYSLWQRSPQPSKPVPHPLQSQPPLIEDKEADKIQSLFETIKQANLKKNIDLFMSCYSLDFKDRKRKRLDTLEIWENFLYLDLTYDLKEQTVYGNTATIKVEWLMKITQKGSRNPEVNRTLLEVILRREEGRWKITEIKPIS